MSGVRERDIRKTTSITSPCLCVCLCVAVLFAFTVVFPAAAFAAKSVQVKYQPLSKETTPTSGETTQSISLSKISYQTLQGLKWSKVRKVGEPQLARLKLSTKTAALRFKLNGNLKATYNLFYRVKVKGFGWMGWTKNGKSAGTTGYGRTVTAVQLRLVKKGTKTKAIAACKEASFVNAKKMLIKVNAKRNVVTIYQGKKPIKVYLCATASGTRSGSWQLKDKHRWRSLLYGVNGQYASRIHNNILFHSVPYRRYGNPRSLIAKDYNALGTNSSHGCVRMAVEGVKYIYDNCPTGTKVVIYQAKHPGPLGKPKLKKISLKQNWDPTDPAIKK
jgi:lipoprotein-anchoring transpeptidase ErfK/SrfK